MLHANQAKEQSMVGEVKTNLSHIEKKIKASAQKGRTETFVLSQLDAESIAELTKNGYNVEKMPTGGYKISWG